MAPPRINLRRAASYNNHDRVSATAPLSSTSSRFNFNHLLFSPPPSPSLPALVPRPKRPHKKLLTSRPSRILRYLVYFIGLSATLCLLRYALQNDTTSISWPYFVNGRFEVVGEESVPGFPMPIMASDGRGRSKWTVSIPHDHDFPLSIEEYSGMSDRCRDISAQTRMHHDNTPLPEQGNIDYDALDDNFVDITMAEKTGLLPPVEKSNPAKKTGHFVGLDWESMAGLPVCQSSLTFVLESPDAGLGTAVMALWTLYGLAQKHNRAFFIDDTRWAYGAYTDIFQAPPVPNCRPPPRHHMIPCPAQARHLVVSSVTAKDIFPALLTKHHRTAGTSNSLRDLFELARVGYRSLYLLNNKDQEYVDTRIQQFKSVAKMGGSSSVDAPIFGLHIRHGDRHPVEYQYQHTYIPTEVFINRAQDLAEVYYNETETDTQTRRAITIIASDDPMVHRQPEFSGALLAQERIRLASKHDITPTKKTSHALHHFEDEAFGWEGGFFASMFWNLGSERKDHVDGEKRVEMNRLSGPTAPPSEQALKLRSLIGRAYMMDLSVLAGASDEVICAVSAMGCRLLGVMMGWDVAIQQDKWVNVDGAYDWAWMDW